MPKVSITFSAKKAAEVSNLKLTMVDYLCREELLVPTGAPQRGRGCRRHYSFGDVVILRALSRLLKAGVEVSRLRHALKRLRKRHPEITQTKLPASFLVTNGLDVYLAEGSEVLEDLNSGQLAFAFVIELAPIQFAVARKLSSSDEVGRRKAA